MKAYSPAKRNYIEKQWAREAAASNICGRSPAKQKKQNTFVAGKSKRALALRSAVASSVFVEHPSEEPRSESCRIVLGLVVHAIARHGSQGCRG